jgi:hypothetical protein
MRRVIGMLAVSDEDKAKLAQELDLVDWIHWPTSSVLAGRLRWP